MTYCINCGKKHEKEEYPKSCSCGYALFKDPKIGVVSVGLVPVGDGFLAVERGISPFVGGHAFPGGYSEVGEQLNYAAAREVFEETGIKLDPNKFIYFTEKIATNKNNLVFFIYSETISESELNNFVPNPETRSLKVVKQGDTLCFPLHQEVLKKLTGDK